ncbi:MAG: glycine cleavage system protein R [Gammaproteobacteria bacterium]|nr:glycine cleavage system protein R [Gammaproteobacteria bacterium]
MRTSLVLTVLGPDHPGLVEALSEIIADHQGNWMESRMAQLAGKFAGILRISVPADQEQALTEALVAHDVDGLRVMVERSQELRPGAHHDLDLELLGHDHPGIIHDITHALVGLGINVEELNSECFDASMSGDTLFKARARLQVPLTVSTDEVREVVEGLAHQLMVDIHLDEST